MSTVGFFFFKVPVELLILGRRRSKKASPGRCLLAQRMPRSSTGWGGRWEMEADQARQEA